MPDDIETTGDVATPGDILGPRIVKDKSIKSEALIDYIATTPQNINYNIVREILTALLNEGNHPYFDYYSEKISQTKEPSSEKPGGEPVTDGGGDTK